MAKEEKSEEVEESKKGSSPMKIVIVAVLIALVVSAVLVSAGLFFLKDMDSSSAENVEAGVDGEEAVDGEEGEEGEAVKLAPPRYHSIGEKFVVSFRDKRTARFMQFSVEIMVRDKSVIEHIEAHSPAVRSNLLMLFDNQKYDLMNTREGKNQLLKDITADINATLTSIVGEQKMKSKVEAAYFTAFVIQ